MKLFAQALANARHPDQAEFFNEFFEALEAYCASTGNRAEAQLSFIVTEMDFTARDNILKFADYVRAHQARSEEARKELPRVEAKLTQLREEIKTLEQKKFDTENPF